VAAIHEPFDAVLHLLDRQVVDAEDLLVCKVDDLELTEFPDGTVAVTALLCGAAALIPRLGGRLGDGLLDTWAALGIQQRGRTRAGRIDLALVDRLTSAVHLNVRRDGLITPQGPPPRTGVRRGRLNELLFMDVVGPGGDLGSVLDVRVRPEHDADDSRLVITELVIGRGRPGSYLGYDRHPHQGPLLLNRLVRRLHRHSGLVPFAEVEINRARGTISCPREPTPLEAAR
jgi:hypothetical protein